MQPTVEVLPPENSPGAVVLLSGKKRKGWKPPATPAVLSIVPVRKAGRKSKYATPEGEELIQKAFERYRGMGEIRSLKAVAEELGLAPFVVRSWSCKFKWNDQIALSNPAKLPTVFKATQERVVEKTMQAVERQVELVKMKQSAMTKPDEIDPSKQVPTEDLTIYALKETGTVLLSAMKTLSEALGLKKTEKEIDAVGTGAGGKGAAQGVMVNVIFKG